MKPIILASVILIAACATSPAATPRLVGSEADVIQMAGVWQAHVESDNASIAGDVELSFEPDGAFLATGGSASIRPVWVRIEGEEVRAALKPYFDEIRAADVYLTFEGTLRDDEIHGVVWERVRFAWANVGSWSAQRVGSASVTTVKARTHVALPQRN